MKIQKVFYPIVNNVIRILLLLVVAGMCLQSMFSTSFIGVITNEDGALQERTLNIADQPWKHLLVFAVFTVVGVLVHRGSGFVSKGDTRTFGFRGRVCVKAGTNSQNMRQGRQIDVLMLGTMAVLIMGAVWIFATRLQPGSDPAKVYAIAMQWRRGDFSAYAEGGYLFRYPFQAGIILFYYLFSFVFGIDNYIGLQFINVIALAAVYGLLVKLSGIFWPEDKKLSSGVYAALILWVPLSFYVTYLYGILPGMALSLGAVYFAAQYLHTRRYRYIVPAALCMGLATVIKMNCLIYLVAIACFLLYDALDIALLTRKELGRQWIGSIVCLVLMICSVAGCNQLCSRYVKHLSGYEAGEGEVMVSWVVMGLQETPLGPGGYSGYISEIFERYEYDTEKIKEASVADIKKIMTRMSENPLDEGIPFFARKNAFQWNDPTFISLDRTRGRKAAGSMPEYARSVIEGKGSVRLSIWLNYVQTLIWIGVILYLILNRKSGNIYELMGTVIFLGGFLFHFFWESSASYTIPYFVILIPYAVKGLADWIGQMSGVVCRAGESMGRNKTGEKQAVKDRMDNLLIGMRRRKVWVSAGVLIVVACLLTLFSRTNLFHRTIALNDGVEAEEQFYHRGVYAAEENGADAAGLTEGYYYLSPYLAQNVAVTVREEGMTLVSVLFHALHENDTITKISEVRDIENKVFLRYENGGVCIRFRSNEQALAIDRSGETPRLVTYLDDSMNTFYEPDKEIAYNWKMRAAENGGYYITIDDLALTYRNKEVTLLPLEKSDEQRWLLQP